MVDPALDGLQRALDSRDLSAVLRAAALVLDRAGLPGRVELENVTPPAPPPSPWSPWSKGEELREIRRLIEKAKRRRDAGEAPARRAVITNQEET